MTRKPAVLWVALCAALFAGCIDAPTAPGATPDERTAPAAFSASSILAESVDDVLTRVLPALAPHAGQGLEAQLRDLRAALNGGSIDRLNDALGATELGLLQFARMPQVPENAADLDVIRVTLNRVSAWLKRNAGAAAPAR